MVKEFGMSQRLGPVAFGRKRQLVFLGRQIGEQRDYSDKGGELIDEEIRRVLDEGYAAGLTILRQHRDELDRLARELLRAESLDAAGLAGIFGSNGAGQPG
jgi:cell division protease FtsH